MGVASMVIGIVALTFGLIPFCGMIWALPAAVVGIGLAIAELLVKSGRKEPKGMAIAGIVLNPLAIGVALSWYFLFVHGVQRASYPVQQQQLYPYTRQQNVPTVPIKPAPAQPGQQPQPAKPVPPGIPTVPLQPPPELSDQPVPPNQPMRPMEPVQPRKPPTR